MSHRISPWAIHSDYKECPRCGRTLDPLEGCSCPAKPAPEAKADPGEVVLTKINPPDRNEQELKRMGNLWFVPDGSMYVYYRPTHWRQTP